MDRQRHDGPLATPKEAPPTTGKSGNVDGVLITTLQQDKIVRVETYWNIPDLLA